MDYQLNVNAAQFVFAPYRTLGRPKTNTVVPRVKTCETRYGEPRPYNNVMRFSTCLRTYLKLVDTLARTDDIALRCTCDNVLVAGKDFRIA
jgi:hypothetical protein